MFDLNYTDILNEHYHLNHFVPLQIRGFDSTEEKETPNLVMFRPAHFKMSFAELLSEIGTCQKHLLVLVNRKESNSLEDFAKLCLNSSGQKSIYN